MNLKSTYYYQLADLKKSLITYYIILLTFFCFILSFFSLTITSNDGRSSSYGQIGPMELITIIFAIFAGYGCLKTYLGFFLQNGISRKTLFTSQILTTSTLALIMATIGKVLLLTFSILLLKLEINVKYSSLFDQVYGLSITDSGSLPYHITVFFYDLSLYLVFMSAGYLIALIYFRISRLGKIVLNVSIPVLLLIALPAFDTSIFKGQTSKGFNHFLNTILGISSYHPSYAIFTFVLLSAIFSGFSWLLLRRATVRD